MLSMAMYADIPRLFGMFPISGEEPREITTPERHVGIIGIFREAYTGDRRRALRETRRFPKFPVIDIDPGVGTVEYGRGNSRVRITVGQIGSVSDGILGIVSHPTQEVSILELKRGPLGIPLPATSKLRRETPPQVENN